MNVYEKKQYSEVLKWEKEEPGLVSVAVGKVLSPVTKLVETIIPPKAIEGALLGANKLAEALTDQKDVLRDAQVTSVDELRTKDLELSDRLASNVQNWAIATAAMEGGATGVVGMLGLAADIPALITMNLRVIHKIGICYGFDCGNEAGFHIIMQIMSAAGANSMKEKITAIAALQRMGTIIAKDSWKKIAEDKSIISIAITLIRKLSKQLGVNISRRVAQKVIPVIGIVMGAAANAAMLNDVAWAARRTFQKLWLLENKKIAPTCK